MPQAGASFLGTEPGREGWRAGSWEGEQILGDQRKQQSYDCIYAHSSAGVHRLVVASSCRTLKAGVEQGGRVGQGGMAGMISKPLPHVHGAEQDSLSPLGGVSCRVFSKPTHCVASVTQEEL